MKFLTFSMGLYLLLVMMSLNISFWWWVWLMLEFMNWVLMSFIKNSSFMMCFMLWQSLSSLGLILNFLFMNNFFLVILFLLLKMGLAPFHYWFWTFCNFWSWKSLILFLFIHKYPSMLILLNFLINSYWNWVLMLPIFSFIMFFFMYSFKNFLFSMSMSDSSWMLFSGMVSLKITFMYFVFNTGVMLILFKICKINSTHKVNMMMLLIFLLIYLSLPPLVSFMLKYLILIMIKMLFSVILLLSTLLNMFLLWSWLYMSSMNMSLYMFNFPKSFYLLVLMNILWFMGM